MPLVPFYISPENLRKTGFLMLLGGIYRNRSAASNGSNTIKDNLRHKTILCHKVALDVHLMNFFI